MSMTLDNVKFTTKMVKKVVPLNYKVVEEEIVTEHTFDTTIPIDPITDVKAVPGHFDKFGDWHDDLLPDEVSTEPTKRDKLFKDLTKGVTS